MAHIFKPGDRAYWLMEKRWVELEKNPGDDEDGLYPLVSTEDKMFCTEDRFCFTEDGRPHERDKWPVLLPLNPYDPADPNNPPEFWSEWSFLLRGRRLEIGMEILVQAESGIVPARIMTLQLSRSGVSVGARHPDGTSSVVWSPVILFPDELPVKKKVAKWAYPTIGVSGRLTVYFTEEITEEEARKVCGSSVEMIPGTEREVEG